MVCQSDLIYARYQIREEKHLFESSLTSIPVLI